MALVSIQLKAQYELYVEVDAAGTLEEVVNGISEDCKYTTASMKVIGPINGHDMMFIRDMCGVKDVSTPTPGKLEILDISDATMEETTDAYLTVNGVDYSSHEYAFCSFYLYNCQHLKEVFLPENINHIDTMAFANCKQLRYLEIPESVERLGYGAFVGCDSIETMVVPNSVLELEDGVFQQMENLQVIYLSDSITHIDNSIFLNDNNLSYVALGRSLREFNPVVFYNSPSLAFIEVSGANPYYTSVEGVMFSHGMDSLVVFPPAYEKENYEVPEGVTRISKSAFCNAGLLKGVVLPSTVTLIDSMAFFNCKSLADVQLNEGLTRMGFGAFGMPEGATAALQALRLPSTLTDIEGGAFLLHPSLASFEIADGNPRYTADEQGLLYSDQKKVLSFVPSMTAQLKMPDSVVEIGPYAFAGVQNLPLIVLGDQVTTIGDGAFAFANGTYQITLGKSTQKIGNLIVDYCRTLSTVYLFADKMEDSDIQEYAFFDESGHVAAQTLLYVLPGHTDYYSNKKGFAASQPPASFFAGIREISDPDAIPGVIAVDSPSEHVFGIDGREMRSMERGVNVVRLPDGRSYKYLVK